MVRQQGWKLGVFGCGLELAMTGCDIASQTLSLYDGQNLIKKPRHPNLTIVFFVETNAPVCVHGVWAL